MKCFRDACLRGRSVRRLRFFTVTAIVVGAAIAATAELPSWIRNIEANSRIEAAFFRMMPLPGGAVAFRRPPREARPALDELIKTEPHNAELYSLRALEDEQQLDFTAAESDWKAYVENSVDKTDAELALAEFYHHRVRPMDEIRALSLVASAPAVAAEKLAPVSGQRSWQAFERIFGVIRDQRLAKDISISQYHAWIARYPAEPSLYARFLEFLIAQKEYSAAAQLITEYRSQFPDDQIFPVKAKATLEYRRGSAHEGLAVYKENFQPLWDPQLVKSYFDLLRETQNLRKFRDDAHAAVVRNPADLSATARLFYYYQQQGNTAVAQQAIADYRLHKESSKSAWTSQELFICARLLEDIHAYPESARYYFALYNSGDLGNAQETSIAGLAGILLAAPEMPIRLGSGDLSMYRDIATLDQGPGYLNGILSLVLNTTQPASQYAEAQQRAVPYFHRSRAAELLELLDAKFPNASRRAELHAQLLEFYANSGESDAVIQNGRDFLATFPKAQQRTSVALLIADAYARTGNSKSEFAIYDAVLGELATNAQNVPLGGAAGIDGPGGSYSSSSAHARENLPDEASDESGGPQGENQAQSAAHDAVGQAFQLGTNRTPAEQPGVRSPEYSRVLERYLARLVEMKQIPAALAVLRRELDRNPDDPGLYERLASFLDQNRLGSQQDEVYRLALSRFSDKSWYDKLARFYIRHRREAEFEQLTHDAIASFKGSELEQYFNNVGGSPGLYLRLNLFAHQRFPHDPVFIRNLLAAYQSKATYDLAAWEGLLRQHWFEAADLRSRFFEFLSSRGTLDAELNAIRESAPDSASWEKNPAAATFFAYGNLWRSHFEESAPVWKSLADRNPADAEIADTSSSVYRSLAYFDSSTTEVAAKIQDNLLQANPASSEIMARIGDIYADRGQFGQATPYWERIPQAAPGKSSGYLDAATIYWDYFDFGSALRMLKEGRDRLGDPDLYAYEAGAIYENERDYPHAIEEYSKGALATPDSAAEHRLLQLASRPKFRELVDQGTTKIVSVSNPPLVAVNLRLKVLEAQNRKPEMEPLLESVLRGVTSIEQAQEIETLAQQKSLEVVRQHAIEKQAVLTTDPVTRLQLRYELVRLYESRKDFAPAQKNIEALYGENPKLLGVIRSTVDFYWRMKMQPQAISVLLRAAKDAYPVLGVQFTYEAARKSTEAKQYQQARDLLAGLLKDSPDNGEYLGAFADTYAQAGDDTGLERFYIDKINSVRSAALSPDVRKLQIATLRRGLIPALTRMKNYSGAIDQYIELINNFPEDDALVTEAALYALRYQRQQQLVDFYAKTVAQSPRDYRWSMVLARTQTNLENFPAALDAYAKAVAGRPDRVDLYTARADLEERLTRFDEAAADYQHVYQLAYKDPQWMEKIATLRARQKKTAETVAALRAALIEGRPESAGNYFEVARRLEVWGMLEQARSFAELGASKAGADLLANADYQAGAKTYARILTRLRQHEQAYATLQKALEDAAADLPVIKEQVERQGVSGLTDARWRENTRRTRIATARNGMESALQEMGSAVNTFFTPEERLAFANFADSKRSGMSVNDVEKLAIPLAVSANLADQEARWRMEAMMQRIAPQRAGLPNYYPSIQSLVDLQRRRGRFADVASQMEQLASAIPQPARTAPLAAAADAYRTLGDTQNELRILSTVFSIHGLDPNRQERYFELLLEKQSQQLVQIASTWSAPYGEKAADYAVAHGSARLAHEIVEARSKSRVPLWNKAYSALVGLYFAEPNPDVNRAFLEALGDDTIAARISKAVDRTQQLAGGTWFYYGSRYGEYLGTAKLGDPEDFLPAILEQSPASSSGYVTLAGYYAGAGETKRAISEYSHALELSPDRVDLYDDLATAHLKQGERSAALAQWKQAFVTLARQLNGARVPESFFRDFGRTCDELHEHRLFDDVKPDADAIVKTYLRVNGTWMSNAMLHSAYSAQANSAAATSWLLDVAPSAADPAHVLGDVVEASWIPLAGRAPIYQRIIELQEKKVTELNGFERESAQQELASWQVRRIRYLVLRKQFAEAATAIATLSPEIRHAQMSALVPFELQVAANAGTLDAKLDAYRTDPESAPSAEILRGAARQLFEAGDKQSARKILELVFAGEIEQHKLVAANFLGLAEIRLADGDTAGALNLLRRLVLAAGNPFENLDPAASLLEKTGHNAEAVEFLDQLVKAMPWQSAYRLRLAKATLAAGAETVAARDSLGAIASESSNSYDLRLNAAIALAGSAKRDLGSGELNLLAAGGATITPSAADKFYFQEARIAAAGNANDPQTKIQLLSHCVIDFPRSDAARIPLFEAASDAQSYGYAVGILEPVFQTLLRSSVPQAANEEEQIANSEVDEQDERVDTESNPRPADTQISRAQRAHLSSRVGDAMIRLGRLQEALTYYQSAHSFYARGPETSAAARKTLNRKIVDTKNSLRIVRDNAARQPLLHEALEQDRVVRPRIEANAANAGDTPVKGRAMQ